MASFQRFIPKRGQRFTLRELLVPVGLLLAFLGVFLLTAPPVWEYTNSAAFCGTTCHTMPPQYTTYLLSPHSRVPCVD